MTTFPSIDSLHSTLEDFQAELGHDGDIHFDMTTRGVFATDASVYQVMPLAVAFPKNINGVQKVVAFCRELGVPITGRGGGTSLSGQAIGQGVIVDFSRYMNKVLEVAADGSWVRVEPGAVLDELNKELAPFGTHFAPDPATGSRATIGGMIGNNSCGTRSIVYGRTIDSVISLRLALADGTEIDTANAESSDKLLRGVLSIVEENKSEIQAKFPNLPRVVAGYALNRLLNEKTRSLNDIIVGGEGTLGLVLEATLRLTPLPKATAVVVVGFDSLDDALTPLPQMLTHKPSAIELLDEVVINEAIKNSSTKEIAAFLLESGKAPSAVQLCEFFGQTPEDAQSKAKNFALFCQENHIGSSHSLCLDKAAQHRAWEVRRLGLGLISNQPGKQKGVSTIEDACVPVENLAQYARFVYASCKRNGIHTATYAHSSVGVLHFKAMLDLHEAPDRVALRKVGEECFEECLRLGGVFSGEHGDGIVRGEFVEKQFGSQLYQAFRQVKALFDPTHLMNPNRKIDAPSLDGPLRYGDNTLENSPSHAPKDYPKRVANITSLFQYKEQGGVVGAIEQCNGVGACRKLGSGNMCPSYRVTKDESHTTRGRANALRLGISGQLNGEIGAKGLADDGLHETLDLCLSCKACKAECPNAVDMARLKSEALQAKWDRDGVSPKARLIGDLPTRAAQFAGTTMGAIGTALTKTSLARWVMEKRYGIDRRRELPQMATQTLDQMLKEKGKGARVPSLAIGAQRQKGNDLDMNSSLRADAGEGTRAPIVLFADTWMRYFEPHIGLAAVEFLESCGFEVFLTKSHDSQRPRLSSGLVREAKKQGTKLFNELRLYQEENIPVVVVEPSDCSSITDDLVDLIDAPDAKVIAQNVFLIDDFIVKQIGKGLKLRPIAGIAPGQTMLHPHCHQRALFTAASPKKILEAAGFSVDAPETGCCGMAGSFGYAHHDLSQKIGEDRLFPAIRSAKEKHKRIIATGTSCRAQLHDFTQTQAAHWVELVRGS